MGQRVEFTGKGCSRSEVVLDGKLYKESNSETVVSAGSVISGGARVLRRTKKGAYWQTYKRNGPTQDTDIWWAESVSDEEAMLLAFHLNPKAAANYPAWKLTVEEA